MNDLQTNIDIDSEIEIITVPKCAYCNRDATVLDVMPALCDKHFAVAQMVHVVRNHNLAATLVNVRKIYQRYHEFWTSIQYSEIPNYYHTLRYFTLFTPYENIN